MAFSWAVQYNICSSIMLCAFDNMHNRMNITDMSRTESTNNITNQLMIKRFIQSKNIFVQLQTFNYKDNNTTLARNHSISSSFSQMPKVHGMLANCYYASLD